MKKVYLVTSGEYSGYHVEACFSSKEKAKDYVKKINKTSEFYGACVETYIVDDTNLDTLVLRPYWYSTINLKDGRIEYEDGRTTEYELAKPHERGESEVEEIFDFDTYIHATSYVSQEHANKLVIEARQAWLVAKAKV